MALLAGHANANTTEVVEKGKEEGAGGGAASSAEAALNAHEKEIKERNAGWGDRLWEVKGRISTYTYFIDSVVSTYTYLLISSLQR